MKVTRKLFARISAVLLAAAMIISGTGVVRANAAEEPTPLETVKKEDATISVIPGQKTHYSIQIKAHQTTMVVLQPKAESASDLIEITNLKIVDANGNSIASGGGYEIDTYGSGTYLSFDLTAAASMRVNNTAITISGDCYRKNSEEGINEDAVLMKLKATTSGFEDAFLSISKTSYSETVAPGNYTDIQFTIKNEGDATACSTYMTIDYGTDSYIVPNYTNNRIKVGQIKGHSQVTVSVPVRVLPNAIPGMVQLNVSLSSQSGMGDEQGPFTQKINVNIVSSKSSNGPKLVISTENNYKEITPGTDDVIPITLTNKGAQKASNITITCAEGFGTSTGITKRYTSEYFTAKNVKAGGSATVEIPVAIAKSVAAGLHELKFTVNYTDEEGLGLSDVMTMYVTVPGDTSDTPRNYLTISNVKQEPAAPVAGEKVTVSFDVTNSGTAEMNTLRVSGSNLSSSGFEPISNDPYVSVGKLAVGATKRVSLSLKCGEYITEGLNTLAIGFEFFDNYGEKKSDTASVYVLNVKGSATTGKPKLIVSEYGTDIETIKAGDEFEFSFTLKNTHPVKDAKNIKITVSQAEGIFAPSTGTNSFYIDRIAAGEEAASAIKLKTRADASTGDYTLTLLVEYEYDDMSKTDLEKGGVSEENLIKIHATENYRPVIENVFIDSWEGVYVGTACDLSFEFYNMGKSTLGNVYVTVEGDFELANNSKMSYVGAINGYSQEYITPSVVPLVEGEATGTVTVHFEDSNGDENTLSQEFTAYVESMGGPSDYDPGMWDDPSMWEDSSMDDNQTGAKLPTWAIVAIAAGGAAVVAVVVIIIVKKSKKKSGTSKSKKKAEDNDDEDY